MHNLAQYYHSPANHGSHPVIWVIYAIIIVAAAVANWKIFQKAGQKGWKAIIPIYNSYTLLKIVDLSGWYLLIFLVPIVNIVFYLYVLNRLVKSFGYGFGMTLLSIVVIGLFIIGFGDAKYKGPPGPIIPDTPYPKQKSA